MKCSIQGCDRRHYGKSYCSMHYMRHRTGADMTAPPRRLHGLSKHKRQNHIWENVKQRCLNPNNPNYPYYGGRGIKLCDEWLDFPNFYTWAMSAGYSDELTLDRIDTNGNYEPANCRWVTRKEQSNNLRKNVILEHQGRKQTLCQWSEELDISDHTLRWRLFAGGWSVHKTLTTPVDTRFRAKQRLI